MNFISKWITTDRFIHLTPLDMFHKEYQPKEISETPVKNYHIHVRKTFTLEDTQNITMKLTADDYYKLYINGKFVCQGPAPAYVNHYNYNEFDISPYLIPGENTFALHLYYQGEINRVWQSADNRMGMVADVFKNGEYIFGTDNTWVYSEVKEFGGETTGYKTTYLENIDFNLEEKGWTKPGFDHSHYVPMAEICPDYTFADEPCELIDVYEIKPSKITKIAPGKYLVDFGCEITGQFYMKVTGKKNQKVRILCGEESKEDNPLEVRYEMRCSCNYDETCTLSGTEDEFNFYDYKTFRYVNVFTDEDNLMPETFSAIVRHHKFKEIRTVETDIPHIKEIWEICSNAVRIAAQGALLDCPSREKGIYLGDFTVSGLSHLYLTGDSKYYKKILTDFANTCHICKGMMAVASSSFMQEIADFSLQYPLQILNYFGYTGDKETVKELLPVAEGIIEHFEKYTREDGLLHNFKDKWNLVDWPMNLRDDYNATILPEEEILDCHNVLNGFFIGAKDTVNKLRDALGMAMLYDTMTLKEAFIETFYNKETGLFCDSSEKSHSALHSNVLPLLFGIATEDMQERLKDFIMEKGLCCGVQFSYFVLKALAKIGAYEEVLSLITNESEHSWVNMLREGATTCYEAWGKEQKWNTSLCHPWASAPIIVLCEDLDGKFGIKIKL